MLFGFYTLGYANSNTGSPMNPYDVQKTTGGRASTSGTAFFWRTWTVPHGFAFSPSWS